ncbi:MAG: CAP domain-containing protein [Clostridioides sp.]|jgi:hypothetical protein|nr:CAP domain-containing protein [Clostridioides sp.]
MKFFKKLITLILVVVIFICYSPSLVERAYQYLDHNSEEQVVKQNIEKNKIEGKSVDNFSKIQIGDSEETLINSVGEPARVDKSGYSFDWYVYNQYGQKFCMVGIEDNKVVAMYSNSINSVEFPKLKLGEQRHIARNIYSPLKYLPKGYTNYTIASKDQYDVIEVDGKYITVFYDIYEGDIICSYQIVEKEVEDKTPIYHAESDVLRKSYELEIMDLTNSVRMKRGLKSLQYSEKATLSSRRHCEDMRDKNYFDHVDRDGRGPADRMKEEGIVYYLAGENIAAGQFSAIYAHEGWMDSEGHRKNILGDYKYIGVGTVFGGSYSMYYGQNFYR